MPACRRFAFALEVQAAGTFECRNSMAKQRFRGIPQNHCLAVTFNGFTQNRFPDWRLATGTWLYPITQP